MACHGTKAIINCFFTNDTGAPLEEVIFEHTLVELM